MLDILKLRFKIFFKLPFRIKMLVTISWLLLGIMRLLLVLFPFNRLTSLMGKANQESPPLLDVELQKKADEVGWSIYTMSKHTPWESKCLVQAMTAQTILRWLRVPGTLYLGVKKVADKNMVAHAWVRCGEHIIVGDYGDEPYKCVAYYSL